MTAILYLTSTTDRTGTEYSSIELLSIESQQRRYEVMEEEQSAKLSPSPNRMSTDQMAAQLNQFTGTEQWYRHCINRQLLYTDGVQFFAENGGECGAYWLLDLIATEYWPLLKKEPFLVIHITVKGSSASIELTDGNTQLLKTRQLNFTDLQEGLWKFYLTDNVLLLPSEY